MFRNVKFHDKAVFGGAIFSNGVYFDASTFSKEALFNVSTFSDIAMFRNVKFQNKTIFDASTFSKEALFIGAILSKEASFTRATFKDNAHFRNIRADETLTFDGTIWGGRVDLRGMSAKELKWDSADTPSEVKGVLDLREAWIGHAIFKEVRFQDVVDFSRIIFGQYRVKDEHNKDKVMQHPSPQALFTNDMFEKEADFLHVIFSGSTVLINNRFRSTLDLTGASFTTPNANLCLSSNRIHRLILGSQNLGRPPGISPFDQFKSLFGTSPLQKSRIRQIAFKETSAPKNNVAPPCVTPYQQETGTDNTVPQGESLDTLYKTMGQSFRETNDQGGVNEAWYLQTVAKREQTATIGDWFSWGFGDIPSRYSVDVWRTVWISIVIMLGFYILYVWELRSLIRSEHVEQGYPRKAGQLGVGRVR